MLQLVVQDLERERRAKNGVENLARAFKQSPNFGNDDSQQNVSEKLHHVGSREKPNDPWINCITLFKRGLSSL